MNVVGMPQGQLIAVVSAAVLVVSLFLAWVGVSGDIPEAPVVPEGTPAVPGLEEAQQAAQDAAEQTGWESQNTLDLYLAIVAGLVLIGAAMTLTGSEGLFFAPAAATFLLGAIGALLTLYVLIDVPEGAERKIGIFLALAGAIGVTVGSYLQMRDEVAADY